jgi:hypothetical protein
MTLTKGNNRIVCVRLEILIAVDDSERLGDFCGSFSSIHNRRFRRVMHFKISGRHKQKDFGFFLRRNFSRVGLDQRA